MERSAVLYNDDGSAKYWGQYEMDRYLIDRYLKHIKKGTYIECGAANGFSQSNTLILECGYEWGGILVEPNPHNYQVITRHRHNCFVANCALVSHDYKEEYIEGFFDGRVLNAKQEVVAGQPSEEEFNNMMGGQIKTNHNYNKKRFSDDEKLLEVPARTLDAIFEESPFERADFFSLDVEGYETEVLKGWSPSKYPVKYVLIEGRDLIEGREQPDPPVVQYMLQHNYKIEEQVNPLNTLFSSLAAPTPMV